MERWLACGWSDCARELRPTDEFYTWWSPRAGSRQRNVGWRIDAQIATKELGAHARHADAPMSPQFSDHAPLIVDYQLPFYSLCGK
jgi:exodeoxyribonuclease-3